MQAKSLLTEKIHIIVSSVYKSNLQGTTLIMLSAHLIYFGKFKKLVHFIIPKTFTKMIILLLHHVFMIIGNCVGLSISNNVFMWHSLDPYGYWMLYHFTHYPLPSSNYQPF